RKWISALSLRRKNYRWKSSDRVCSAHFPGGHKYGSNNIPSIFPRRDLKSGEIVWPVDISSLLQDKSNPTAEDKKKSTSTVRIVSANSATFPVNAENIPPNGKSGLDEVVVQQDTDKNNQTVTEKAENFPLKSKTDDNDSMVQQGLDAKGDCLSKHEIS
ncbi:hypothetical protein ACROYT_G014475, partial [Oculina patagonica]